MTDASGGDEEDVEVVVSRAFSGNWGKFSCALKAHEGGMKQAFVRRSRECLVGMNILNST